MSKPTREDLLKALDTLEREILRLQQDISILKAQQGSHTAQHKAKVAKLRRALREAKNAAPGRARRN